MSEDLSATAGEGLRGVNLASAETPPPISVAQIIAGIDDRYHLLQAEDGRFERECIELLELIDQTRVDQGYVPYDNSQRIIVVRELYRVMEKFRAKKRRSGGSYFFEHLMGATKILVRDIGLNGPGSIIAEANHDSLEDLIDEEAINHEIETALAGRRAEVERELTDPEIKNIQGRTRRRALAEQINALKEGLVDTSGYKHLIPGFDKDAAERVAESVRLICEGVTKESLPTVEATRDATLHHLLAFVMRNVKSVFIKFPDRKHNLLTLDGLLFDKDGLPLEGDALEAGKAKQRKIVEETERVYLPLARRTGVRKMVRFFVDQCMNFQNPELAAGFSALSRQRLSGRIEPAEAAVRSEFETNRLVHGIEFVPRGLDFYTARSDKRLQDLTLNDLKIGRRDPMFDIVITTSMESDSSTDPTSAMESVLVNVQNYFGAGDGTRVEIERPDKGDLTGIRVHVFNPKFGGHLSIRINDRYIEKKLDRGILVNFKENPSEELRGLIISVLDRKAEPDMGHGAVDRGQRELLASQVGVYDIKERLRLFPYGATVLDFAYAIHGDVLEGALRAYVEDNGPPEATFATPVHLIDYLIPGKVYFVESCLAKGVRDRSRVAMHPVLIFFCQSGARKNIRQFLKDPWVSAMEGLTEEQLAFIRELNRKRNVSVQDDERSLISGRIAILKEGKPKIKLNNNKIIKILKQQDAKIDLVGKEFLKELSDLFGVSELLIIEYLATALGLKPKIEPSPKGASADQVKRFAKINRAVGIGDSKANPLLVLADHFEQIAMQKRSSFRNVKDRLWEVQIVVPDRAGELSEFGREFSRETGINLYSFKNRKRPKQREDVMIFKIDPEGQNISIYEFLVKLVRLRLKYPSTRLTRNPYMDVVRNKSEVFGR